jgi:hypothetical protein
VGHYNLWQQNFGRYAGDGGGSGGQVPEPAAGVLAALSFIVFIGTRRFRRVL